MAGKKDKGKAPMRRVSIAEEEDGPRSPLASPGTGNFSRHPSHGSPASSHTSASGSQSQSHSKPKDKKPTTTAPASVLQTPVPQFAGTQYGNWLPYPGAHAVMAALQPAAPAPVNPPDELGPPPPPPPPPAIPPVVNPFGIHFQPQVPGTEMGPMMHRYMPRHDVPGAPGMFMQGHQMPGGYMANGGVGYPMHPMHPMHVGVANVTAPVHPVVVQRPGGHPKMIANQSVPGGPPLMLPAPAQVVQMPGNPSLMHGVPTQPPVHVEPAMGVGLTPNETIAENVRMAQNNKAYEPQDIKPADPDPYRMYWFRELNGHWAVFPRRQIDRLDARWYRTNEGIFYAIRLTE